MGSRLLARMRLQRSRRVDGSKRQRGAVLAEAAFVFPVLMFVTLGIVEFGMAYGNAATVRSASRAGARLGATGYSPAADKTVFAGTISDEVRGDLTALSRGAPISMWVYKATVGEPATCTAATSCWAFTWNTTTKDWNTPTGGWSDPDSCGATLDSIGVKVTARHDFASGYFGASKTITYRTRVRLEPLPSDQCLAGS